MFFQQDQINTGDAIEDRRDNGNFTIAKLAIHGSGALVAGVGVDAQLRPFVL